MNKRTKQLIAKASGTVFALAAVAAQIDPASFAALPEKWRGCAGAVCAVAAWLTTSPLAQKVKNEIEGKQ